MSSTRFDRGRGVLVGAAAGAAGTAAMDLLLYRRYRREDGKESLGRWEFAAGVISWETAFAPGQLGRKMKRLLTRREPTTGGRELRRNAVHWVTGIGWGVQYGLLAGMSSRHTVMRAAALGPAAWPAGYVILPLAGVYQPIWKYDAQTLGKDLSARLVFGAGVSAAFAALTRVRS